MMELEDSQMLLVFFDEKVEEKKTRENQRTCSFLS
jgi:hypothetical protein